MIRRLSAFLFIFLIVLPVAGSKSATAAGAGNTAISVVANFHKGLLTIMKAADKLGIKGRYKYIAPRVAEAFDISRMLRTATGSFWKKADKNQQNRLIEAFTRMSASTYASQFNGYSGEKFKTIGSRPGPRGTVLVETQIILPKDSPVAITYVVRKSAKRWLIIDVLLDNSISELAVRRSEYRQMLKSKGMEGLIDLLNRKAASLIAG